MEQKNWTHVRQWLGYQRLDNPRAIPFLNNLYRNEWRLFHNFFCHPVKLIAKEGIGSKTVKQRDKPKTPYQESSDLNAIRIAMGTQYPPCLSSLDIDLKMTR